MKLGCGSMHQDRPTGHHLNIILIKTMTLRTGGALECRVFSRELITLFEYFDLREIGILFEVCPMNEKRDISPSGP